MRKHFVETKIAIVIIFLGMVLPVPLLAQAPSSTHYRLDNSQFDFGGQTSTSTHYQSLDALGGSTDETKSTSSSFRLFAGLILPLFPAVPAPPTLTNTGSNLYNSLDFVINTGGNASDVYYAIAISSDGFSTTNYVQSNDTVAATTTWRSYIDWGSGTGQRITGLSPNTTYTIKVKARYGVDSETGFSGTAQATTVTPTLTATIQGISNATTIGTFTTNIATTATAVPFSNLQSGSIKLGAQKITVTTNALAGYTTAIAQDNNLVTTKGSQISPVSASNGSPASWPAGITDGRFGYHTTDSSLCTGTSGRFATDDTFAALTTSPLEVACNTGPASSEVTNIIFKVEIGALQASGDYKNNITYVTTAQY